MTISSDLPSLTPLQSVNPLRPSSEAAESKSVPDRDGDSDDRASTVSLRPYQGTKVNTTV